MARILDSGDFVWSHLPDTQGEALERPIADIVDVFNGDLGTAFYIRGKTTVHKMLGTINRIKHLQLSTRDVANAVIGEHDTEFTLKMYRYAPKHKGSVKVKINRIPTKVDLGLAITTTEYNGLLIQTL